VSGRKRFSELLIAVVIFAFAATRLDIAKQKDDPRPPTLSKEEWQRDLRYFAEQLPKRHKNLYHAVSREQFERDVADLEAAIPALQDHEIIVRLQQIAARVGDGHTGVQIPPYFKRYPLALFWFGDDLRVIAASSDYEKALGARVVKIGSLSLEEAQVRVNRCFPSAENENAWYVLATSPAFLVVPEILHATGVVSNLGPASFTFEDESGTPFTLEIAPAEVPIVNGVPTMNLNPAAKTPPLWRQKPGEKFWFTYLPESKTVYTNFRGYEGLGANAKALFRLVDANPTSRLVIDMRQNGGGDFFEGRKHLIQAVKERPALNAKGHLFVVVGRRTFSAALANAVDFRKDTNAILVGEPIGERPNSYSENDEMKLPNSRIVVSYSTKYYKFVDEDVPAVIPDKRIDPTWPEFRAGRDPVMEWILTAN
jgi:hypothetical protein